MATPLEIERKWMVHSWPNGLPLLEELEMAQGYVSTKPTVRIRSGRGHGEEKYILCFKSKSFDGGLSRKELELPLEKEEFRRLEEFIGLPLIQKLRRTYALPDGNRLEVSHVDEGLPSEFWYAEVEFQTAAEAKAWQPSSAGLEEYLLSEVTGLKGQSMAAYWKQTRVK